MQQARQHGFSLIEVLVAMFVLSIGMLGIGALFISGLQDSSSAIYRTRAINFAEDMADRIRANPEARASYAVDYDGSGTDNACSDTDTVVAAACTEAELAAHDIYTWKQAISSAALGLPAGKGQVTIDTSTTPPTYTVSVQWSERGGDAQTYTTSFQAQ
ncbi:MAG TPA: type IV pilus modification protein PilV [Gammaproteobacteria bacterium]|nr:type IV pilus modification protein PilV [Gammaproteobacteria bacterium]